jgi:hypothetical protein
VQLRPVENGHIGLKRQRLGPLHGGHHTFDPKTLAIEKANEEEVCA